MRPTIVTVCAFVFVSALDSSAQEPVSGTRPRKQARIGQVANGSIHVDGRLDEELWLRAEPISDFVQKEPEEGAPPTDSMEVRFVYDDDTLYVGARMFTENETRVQAPLSRRDETAQAENILVAFDTFYDHLTAAEFGVTASGVRLDRFYPSDNRDSDDSGFDPVWEAKTGRDANSWTAEMSIPFSQLRFSAQSQQVWGLQVRRFRPNLDEEDYWVLIPRTERIWASGFGDLHGISALSASRRIELLPYVAGASTLNSTRDLRNPFDDGRNLVSRAGADVKMGLGPNLTLNATVNPDFGQVEADPAEVNLSRFETRFAEKRPFFLEGSQLFSISHPNFYYSRRIGGRPTGPASGEFVDYPTASTILGAAKLTGRLPSRTSIGVLSAVTSDESAEVTATGSPLVSEIPVAPLAYWNIARVQQEFGRLGSTAGLLFNSMHRNLSPSDALDSLLDRNAMAVAGDTTLRFKGGEYQLTSVAGASFLNGSPKAVERIQRSSSHYAQRPDKSYGQLDATRTSLAGWSTQTRFDRVSGRHWLWNVSSKVDSVYFETNDIANLMGADGIQPGAGLTYRETRPNRFFRSYSFGVTQSLEWNFDGDRQSGSTRQSMNLTWRNYWTSNFSVTRNLSGNDAGLTRGGPLMSRPTGWAMSASFGNRSTSQTRWSTSLNASNDEFGGSTRRISGSVSARPGPRWSVSAAPSYDRTTDTQQYITTQTGNGRPETYSNRYIFAIIDRSTLSTAFRMGFTVRPDMNVDVYAEPFAASGRYYDFGELARPKTSERVVYGVAPGTTITTAGNGDRLVTDGATSFTLASSARDFNTLSFRSNIVLRWEWRLGSTLYLVWQQSRASSEVLGAHVSPADMFRSVRAPGSNYFIVKTSFWLPTS